MQRVAPSAHRDEDDGLVLTVHCPNSGSMRTCVGEGWPVHLSISENPNRKYPQYLRDHSQRPDGDGFTIADDIDPTYGEELSRAMAAGVEVLAFRADLSPKEIRVVERIAVEIPSTSNV